MVIVNVITNIIIIIIIQFIKSQSTLPNLLHILNLSLLLYILSCKSIPITFIPAILLTFFRIYWSFQNLVFTYCVLVI